MKKTALITKPGRQARRVYLQQAADNSGGFWATAKPENSNTGWTLNGDGTVVRERYHARTNERLASERVTGATWERENVIRKFLGREIGTEIVKAIEALPAGAEIIEFKAGENMAITCGFQVEDDGRDDAPGWFPEYAWDGETWNEIGYL